jgi:hypothetical protein
MLWHGLSRHEWLRLKFRRLCVAYFNDTTQGQAPTRLKTGAKNIIFSKALQGILKALDKLTSRTCFVDAAEPTPQQTDVCQFRL